MVHLLERLAGGLGVLVARTGRRVGAVVYKRRLHIVNVFMWPSASAGDAAPRLITHNGYNLIVWSRGGIDYWAVSDLNAGDLAQLQALL